MADDRTIRVRFLAEIGNYLDGMRKAGTATADFGKNLSGRGTAVKADIEKVGRAALVMSGGMALALGAATKAAIDWESAFAGVAKTVDGDLTEIEAGLRDLATELPATHKEIAAVAEAAGQLGIAKGSILDFTETMIALGETTNLTADEAATSIAQFMNIMRTAPEDVDNLASALVDLGNNGASTERDIVEMAQRLAGAGRMIGASDQEILALSSAMADLGIQAQLGGGAMSRQLRKINSAVHENGKGLEGWARIANVSAKEFADVWRDSPAAAMDLVARGLGRVRDAGGDVAATLEEVGVKGTQDLDVMGRLAGAGDRISKSLGISNEAWEKNVALQEEAAKRYGTTESKMQITRNKVNDLAIDLGAQLLPAVSLVLDAVGGLADLFGSLPGVMQGGIVALGTIAVTAGGIVGVIGTLAPKVRELDTALQSMGLGAGFASRNLGRIATVVSKGGVLLAGLFALGEATDALWDKDHSGNVTEMENALARLADGATISSLKDLGLDLDEIGAAVERIASPSIATQADNVIDSVSSLGGLLGESFNDLDAAKERVDGLDKALESLALRDPNAAAAALEAIRRAIGDQAFQRLLPLLDDYEVALAGLDTAGRTGAEAIDEVTNAAGVSEQAISDLAEEIDALFNSLYGAEAAADAFQQGLNDLDDTVKTAVEQGVNLKDVLMDQSDGALTLRGHMRDLVSDANDLIQEWVEQGATGAELQANIDHLSQSFREQAEAAGVPGPVVEHYLTLLGEIPAAISTSFTVEDNATPVINSVNSKLDLLGRRTTIVDLQAKHPQLFPMRGGSAQGGGGAGGFATGGLISQHLAVGGVAGFPGRPIGTDTVPIWGTPGEYMVRQPVVRALGVPFMDALNAGMVRPGSSSPVVNLNVTVPVQAGIIANERQVERVVQGAVVKALDTDPSFRRAVNA